MSKTLNGITIETFPDAVKQAGLKPGQRFSITVGEEPDILEIAERMRQDAISKGLTTEIFDRLISEP